MKREIIERAKEIKAQIEDRFNTNYPVGFGYCVKLAYREKSGEKFDEKRIGAIFKIRNKASESHNIALVSLDMEACIEASYEEKFEIEFSYMPHVRIEIETEKAVKVVFYETEEITMVEWLPKSQIYFDENGDLFLKLWLSWRIKKELRFDHQIFIAQKGKQR